MKTDNLNLNQYKSKTHFKMYTQKNNNNNNKIPSKPRQGNSTKRTKNRCIIKN